MIFSLKDVVVRVLCSVALFIGCSGAGEVQHVRTWMMHEITMTAQQAYTNPYTDVDVWVNLQGPDGSSRKVFGFWDGGNTFRVRVIASTPGRWNWTSDASVSDPGLQGKTGGIDAVEWSEEEKQANPNRRGFLRATANGHALQYADGTPFFLLADTWWSLATFRFPLKGTVPAPDYVPGPGIGLEEAVQYRKRQGYNSIAMIACFPAWADDGHPARFFVDDVLQRDAWRLWETGHSQNMHDDQGNRPFEFPGLGGNTAVVPNYDKINPAYFQTLDRKMQYLSDEGMAPFFEIVRRDHGLAWKAYHDFESSYARYINYMTARYGAWNIIFSALHRDMGNVNEPDPRAGDSRDWNDAIMRWFRTYGPMPFGQPFTVLAVSTQREYGQGESAPWLTIHNVGNKPRNSRIYPEIERVFTHPDPKPLFNSEPFYPGWGHVSSTVAGELPAADSPRADYFARSQMYGSVLSGALAGHIYGTGAYNGAVAGEDPGDANMTIWDALVLKSGRQMEFFKEFILSEGAHYQSLQPARHLLNPNRNSAQFVEKGLTGQGYLMISEDKMLALAYFEELALPASIAGLLPRKEYQARWFHPATGEWYGTPVVVASDAAGTLPLLPFPDGNAMVGKNEDWALKLILIQ